MIKTFLRPNLIKRINIRTNCDLKCNDKYVNSINQQTQTLNKISENTRAMATITVINFITQMVLISIPGVTYLANRAFN